MVQGQLLSGFRTLRGLERADGFVPGINQVRRINTNFKAEKPELIKLYDRPIGDTSAPGGLDHQGIDNRSFDERKRDLKDYKRHLARREELKDQLFKSSFDAIYRFRDTAGKFWIAPGSYFKKDKSLYMPNFWGQTLASGIESTDTTSVLAGKISVVRVFSSVVGETQTKSFFQTDPNKMIEKEEGFQIVDINNPDSVIKEWIVKLFKGKLRKQVLDPARHSHYFICRKGVSNHVRTSIKAENVYGGYVYLVDEDCKIRWAACGVATKDEKANLARFIKALKAEQQNSQQK